MCAAEMMIVLLSSPMLDWRRSEQPCFSMPCLYMCTVYFPPCSLSLRQMPSSFGQVTTWPLLLCGEEEWCWQPASRWRRQLTLPNELSRVFSGLICCTVLLCFALEVKFCRYILMVEARFDRHIFVNDQRLMTVKHLFLYDI